MHVTYFECFYILTIKRQDLLCAKYLYVRYLDIKTSFCYFLYLQNFPIEARMDVFRLHLPYNNTFLIIA